MPINHSNAQSAGNYRRIDHFRHFSIYTVGMLSTMMVAVVSLMMGLVVGTNADPVPMYPSQQTPVQGDAGDEMGGETPPWHSPCGQNTGAARRPKASFKIGWHAQLTISLRRIRNQLKLTIRHYVNQNFELLYKEVRLGMLDHQFSPNWVPGKGDVNILTSQPLKQKTDLAKNLPKLHEDFQKFAVGLEAILATEIAKPAHKVLRDTQQKSRLFLCEVETALTALEIAVPPRVHRDIMVSAERTPEDELRRRLRDWGILMKYRDYLKGWNTMFNKKLDDSRRDRDD